MRTFGKSVAVAAAVSGLFLTIQASFAASITITAVGLDTTTQGDWRTTTTAKPFDIDGNNVYGFSSAYPNDSGYYVFAPRAPFGLGGGGSDTAFSATDINGLPSWLTLTADGADHYYTGAYPLIDDPTLTPDPSVADMRSGISYKVGVPANTDTSIYQLTFGPGTPSGTIRIGLFENSGTGPITSFTLTSGASSDTQTFGTGAGSIGYAFFNVTNAADGDVLTILGQITTANGNLGLSGITIDVPEPASLGSLVLGGGLTLMRRRKRT